MCEVDISFVKLFTDYKEYYLVLCNNLHTQCLETTYIYNLSFWGSGVWAELNWVLCLESFTGCNEGVSQGRVLIWRSNWGRICLQTHMVLAAISSLKTIRLRDSVSYWLLSRPSHQFFVMWNSLTCPISV